MTTTTTQEVLQLHERDLPNWGGFQDAADWINAVRGLEISRQRVYSLHRWRHGNKFPASRVIRLPNGVIKHNWFYKPDVEAWARAHKFRNSGSLGRRPPR